MPVIEVEVVGEAAPDLAQRLADALGAHFAKGPSRTWVRLRRLDAADYAENGGAGPARPVFARVLLQHVPTGAALLAEVDALTRLVAEACDRPRENVHLLFDPSAAGRASFGGRVVPPSDERFGRVSSGAPWEDRVGYCRAVRAGDRVFVTGTAPVADDGSTYAPGDAEAQAARCLALIERALGAFGLDRAAIVRTRMFVTDIDRWESFGRAHRAFFGDRHPATTMVEVSRLIAPDMLIEIEADAVA